MKNFKDKIRLKYTPKRNKLNHLKKNVSGGACTFPNLKQNFLAHPPKSHRYGVRNPKSYLVPIKHTFTIDCIQQHTLCKFIYQP